MLLSKNHTLEWQKRLKKRDPMQLFAEKGDFSNKKRPKRDPKSGLGLLRDPGLPKRDPVGSSARGSGDYWSSSGQKGLEGQPSLQSCRQGV